MRTVIVAAAVGLICTGVTAAAQDPVQIGAAEVVAGRKAGMALSGAAMSSMKAAIDAGGPVRTQAFAAGGVARWGQAIPGMFPTGTGQGQLGAEATDAKDGIWASRADFEATAASFATEAGKLAELARADDAAGFAAQWTVVRAACQSCHEVYKAD
jgi:cytochrome c556